LQATLKFCPLNTFTRSTKRPRANSLCGSALTGNVCLALHLRKCLLSNKLLVRVLELL
jgi:hypothetical protein